ncbi:hypothetical protein C8J57DRAFT_656376 [Mycena rebaudengoi]|nr:hypothetical protein C8J57DRAFT_656376 [Mycena rebaudengoi]
MAFFRCRAFLGCLSLKTGACLLAFIAMMVGGMGAAGSWLEVSWIAQHPLDLRDKASIFAQAIIFSTLFVLSFLGLVAAITGTRSGVYIYSKFIFIHSALMLLSLGFTLYSTFRAADPDQAAACLNGSNQPIISQFCNRGWSVIKIVPIALLGSSLAVQIFAWIIAISYVDELELDDASSITFNFPADKVHRSQRPDLEANWRSTAYPFARR